MYTYRSGSLGALGVPPSLHSYCSVYPNDKTCLPGGKSYCLAHPGDASCPSTVVADALQTTATTATTHWGLIAAGCLAAYVVYKVATL